jgi:hypothetical protein
MNAFEMVIVIVIVGCATGVINNFIKHKNAGRSEDMDDLLDRLDGIEELEERVRVLEKVITDENYELKKQFQDLEKD